jgi:hypothetical protein
MSKQLSKDAQEKLSLMNGCECHSIKYEDCVYIQKNKVISMGEVVDTLDTDKKVNDLWSEYLQGEGF